MLNCTVSDRRGLVDVSTTQCPHVNGNLRTLINYLAPDPTVRGVSKLYEIVTKKIMKYMGEAKKFHNTKLELYVAYTSNVLRMLRARFGGRSREHKSKTRDDGHGARNRRKRGE